MTDEQIQAIAEKVRVKAAKLRNDAGYSGRMDDGGASTLLSNLEFWLAGLQEQIPEAFQEYADEITREADPEWAEYQRLQKKFSGK